MGCLQEREEGGPYHRHVCLALRCWSIPRRRQEVRSRLGRSTALTPPRALARVPGLPGDGAATSDGSRAHAASSILSLRCTRWAGGIARKPAQGPGLGSLEGLRGGEGVHSRSWLSQAGWGALQPPRSPGQHWTPAPRRLHQKDRLDEPETGLTRGLPCSVPGTGGLTHTHTHTHTHTQPRKSTGMTSGGGWERKLQREFELEI